MPPEFADQGDGQLDRFVPAEIIDGLGTGRTVGPGRFTAGQQRMDLDQPSPPRERLDLALEKGLGQGRIVNKYIGNTRLMAVGHVGWMVRQVTGLGKCTVAQQLDIRQTGY